MSTIHGIYLDDGVTAFDGMVTQDNTPFLVVETVSLTLMNESTSGYTTTIKYNIYDSISGLTYDPINYSYTGITNSFDYVITTDSDAVIQDAYRVITDYFDSASINYTLYPQQTTLITDLVATWEFDESSGSILYDKHGSNDGTVYGATMGQTGLISNAYEFDGINDYINVGDLGMDFTKDFSISVWIKPHNFLTSSWYYVHIFSNYSMYSANMVGLFLYPHTTKDFCTIMVKDDSDPLDNSFSRIFDFSDNINNWTHVVCRWDASTHTTDIYKNGSFSESNTDVACDGCNRGSDWYVAHCPGATSNDKRFDGLIDQIAIWDKKITTTEISLLYNSGSGLTYSNW